MLVFLDELEDVAAPMTGEAIKNLFAFVHAKRRRVFRHERAQAKQVLPLLVQLHVLTNVVGNINRAANLIDDFSWNARDCGSPPRIAVKSRTSVVKCDLPKPN